MAKYRVIPIKISLKNNKFAEHGDIVDDSQLNSLVYDLIRDGFIELVQEDSLDLKKVSKELVSNKEEVLDVEEKEVSKKDEVKANLNLKK